MNKTGSLFLCHYFFSSMDFSDLKHLPLPIILTSPHERDHQHVFVIDYININVCINKFCFLGERRSVYDTWRLEMEMMAINQTIT